MAKVVRKAGAGSAIVVVDLVNDFVTGVFGNGRAVRTAERTAEFLQKVGNTLPLIFTMDTHLENDPEFAVWGRHCVAGTEGSMLAKVLSSFEGHRITKRHFDSFYDSDLDGVLRANGISRIFLSGISTDICVLHTAAGEFFRNYGISVISDLCSSIAEENHNIGLENMRKNYGARIITAEDALSEIL